MAVRFDTSANSILYNRFISQYNTNTFMERKLFGYLLRNFLNFFLVNEIFFREKKDFRNGWGIRYEYKIYYEIQIIQKMSIDNS